MKYNEIRAAGYVIQDQYAIYGVGSTVEAAWATAAAGQFSETTETKAVAASEALLAQVAAEGGAIAWGVVDGVACTVAEEDLALDVPE